MVQKKREKGGISSFVKIFYLFRADFPLIPVIWLHLYLFRLSANVHCTPQGDTKPIGHQRNKKELHSRAALLTTNLF